MNATNVQIQSPMTSPYHPAKLTVQIHAGVIEEALPLGKRIHSTILARKGISLEAIYTPPKVDRDGSQLR